MPCIPYPDPGPATPEAQPNSWGLLTKPQLSIEAYGAIAERRSNLTLPQRIAAQEMRPQKWRFRSLKHGKQAVGLGGRNYVRGWRMAMEGCGADAC